MNSINQAPQYPCPCCGYEVLVNPPGSYEICPICYWEDDETQLCDPNLKEGANHVSLIEGQDNFLRNGWSDERYTAQVSPAQRSDRRAPRWRPVRKGTNDETPIEVSNEWTKDQKTAMICYWLRNR